MTVHGPIGEKKLCSAGIRTLHRRRVGDKIGNFRRQAREFCSVDVVRTRDVRSAKRGAQPVGKVSQVPARNEGILERLRLLLWPRQQSGLPDRAGLNAARNYEICAERCVARLCVREPRNGSETFECRHV